MQSAWSIQCQPIFSHYAGGKIDGKEVGESFKIVCQGLGFSQDLRVSEEQYKAFMKKCSDIGPLADVNGKQQASTLVVCVGTFIGGKEGRATMTLSDIRPVPAAPAR